MNLRIAGRWALVGGASRGLGFACARALVREGVNVVCVARSEKALFESASALEQVRPHSDVRIVSVAADITDDAGRETIFNHQYGPGRNFDILVTNAGGPPPGDFREWDENAWQEAIRANMYTPIALIKTVIDGMVDRGFGRIVNITSGAVKAPIADLGLSNGARSGLTGFVAGLARSPVAAANVTINNLLPGAFLTDRLKSASQQRAEAIASTLEAVLAERADRIPSRRLGDPEEFGRCCAFLCSVHAGYLTGQNIMLDGGAYPGVL